MTKDEALKLVLEAMTYADACLKKQLTTKDKHEYAQDLLLEAGTAIREALAQPAQRKPWVGLTEQEHTDIAIQCGCMSADWVFYGATVERILKEKNS